MMFGDVKASAALAAGSTGDDYRRLGYGVASQIPSRDTIVAQKRCFWLIGLGE